MKDNIITCNTPYGETIQVNTDNLFIGRISPKEKNELTNLTLDLWFETSEEDVNRDEIKIQKDLDKLFEKTVEIKKTKPSVVSGENFVFLVSCIMSACHLATLQDIETSLELTQDYFDSVTYYPKGSTTHQEMQKYIIVTYVVHKAMATLRSKNIDTAQKREMIKKLILQTKTKNLPKNYLVQAESNIAYECAKAGCFDIAKELVIQTLETLEGNVFDTIYIKDKNNKTTRQLFQFSPINNVIFLTLKNLYQTSTRIYLNNLTKLNFNDAKTTEKLKENIQLIRKCSQITNNLINPRTLDYSNKYELIQLNILNAATNIFALTPQTISVERLIKNPTILDVSDNTLPIQNQGVEISHFHGQETSLIEIDPFCPQKDVFLNLSEQDIASICSIPDWIQITNNYTSLEKMDYSPMLIPINKVIENKLHELYTIYTKDYIPYLIDNDKKTPYYKTNYSKELLTEYKKALEKGAFASSNECKLTIGQFCQKITGQDSYITGSPMLEPLKNNLDLFVDFVGEYDGITLGLISHLIEYAAMNQNFRNTSSHNKYLDKKSFEKALSIGLLSDYSIIKNASQILNGTKIQSLKDARKEQQMQAKKAKHEKFVALQKEASAPDNK